MKTKKGILILVIIAILLILFSIILMIFGKPKSKYKSSEGNRYIISNKEYELPGTKKHTNDMIKKAHCIDKICIEDVVIYYADEGGRLEYRITNKSSKTANGYLKIVYDNHDFLVSYHNLEPNSSVESMSEFKGVKISDKDNYTLKKLTAAEIKKIIK